MVGEQGHSQSRISGGGAPENATRDRISPTMRRARWALLFVLTAGAAILASAALGVDMRLCKAASALLSLFMIGYAVWAWIALRRDNARLKRQITIAALRFNATREVPLPRRRPRADDDS